MFAGQRSAGQHLQRCLRSCSGSDRRLAQLDAPGELRSTQFLGPRGPVPLPRQPRSSRERVSAGGASNAEEATPPKYDFHASSAAAPSPSSSAASRYSSAGASRAWSMRRANSKASRRSEARGKALASGRVPKAHGYTLSVALKASRGDWFLEEAAQAAREDGGEGAAGGGRVHAEYKRCIGEKRDRCVRGPCEALFAQLAQTKERPMLHTEAESPVRLALVVSDKDSLKGERAPPPPERLLSPAPDLGRNLSRSQIGDKIAALTAVWGDDAGRHPDGLVRAAAHAVGHIGMLLIGLDLPDGLCSESKADMEGQLRRILLACESEGVRLEWGGIKGLPRPEEIGWCARQVREHLAAIEFHNLQAEDGRPAEPSISEDPESIARAMEQVWLTIAARPCPLTGAPLVAAVRDLQVRLDDRWKELDRFEKARQVVLACLKRAGVKKPSAFFDAERKSKTRVKKSGTKSERRARC